MKNRYMEVRREREKEGARRGGSCFVWCSIAEWGLRLGLYGHRTRGGG